MEHEEKLLEISDLHVKYVTERATGYALNGVNLTLNKGESLGLVGEAGAGKTTIALSILKLLPAAGQMTQGDIRFKGKSVNKMTSRELLDMRGNRVAMIFQNPLTSLNPVFTVGEQIAVLLRQHMKMSRKQANKKTMELLETVGIPGARLKEYPNQFSGGMRQRVGIAAAIACNPEILIADEPTTALDVTIQAQILELMKRLQKEYHTSLLMITHNLGIISELCEKVAVMYAGRIIEYGTVAEVFAHPAHPYTRGLLGALPKLDGGMRQVVGIARALALDPSFIVCDEPVSALDVSVQAKIINMLMDLQKERNLSYLFISHDLSVVRHISNRIAVMYLGKIVETAPTDTIFADARHPYTIALLSAVPKVSTGKKVERIVLQGDVPSPIDPKPGCRFAQRCWMACPECAKAAPPLTEVEPGHFVACYRAEESRKLMEQAQTTSV